LELRDRGLWDDQVQWYWSEATQKSNLKRVIELEMEVRIVLDHKKDI